jgi:hypothetical protein
MGCRADRPLPGQQAFRDSPSDRESPQVTTRIGHAAAACPLRRPSALMARRARQYVRIGD